MLAHDVALLHAGQHIYCVGASAPLSQTIHPGDQESVPPYEELHQEFSPSPNIASVVIVVTHLTRASWPTPRIDPMARHIARLEEPRGETVDLYLVGVSGSAAQRLSIARAAEQSVTAVPRTWQPAPGA